MVRSPLPAQLTLLAALVLVVAACGSATKASAPAEVGAPEAPAQTTTVVTSDPAGTKTPSSTTSAPAPTTTTESPVPSSTIVAIDDLPRTTAPATEEEPVPPGEVVELTGLWDIVVTEVRLDAADDVLAFADINPVPEPGFQYVLVTIAGRYLGERAAQPAFVWWMTDGTEVFEPWIPGCGVVPDSIYDIFELAGGESFVANVCLPVPAASVQQGLALSLQPQGGEAFYFELAEDA